MKRKYFREYAMFFLKSIVVRNAGAAITLAIKLAVTIAVTFTSLAVYSETSKPVQLSNQAKLPTQPQLLAQPPPQAAAFFAKNDYGVREGLRTDGVLITQNGQNIYERYERGFRPQQKHIQWSVSKTVTVLLYGVARREGRVQLTQSICDFIKTDDQSKCTIRIQDVLTWSTALYWSEEYENASEIKKSSVVAMLYGEGSEDMNRFVLKQPMLNNAKPGEVWRYSSGDTVLAAKILAAIYKEQDLRQVFQDKLFAPLGITDWSCESDDHGVLGGAFYFYLTLPDMIKIGELILGRGQYQKKQIFDEEFYQFLVTMPEAFKKRRLDHHKGTISGAHIWLNDTKDTGLPQPWPEAPLDALLARGHWGQYLFIVPSLKLVAARVGDNRDGSLKVEDFIRQVMAMVKSDQPIAALESKTKVQKTVSENVVSKSENAPSQEAIEYRDGRVKLGLAFTAKNFCSCLFVMNNTEERCRDYASLKQISPLLSVDYKTKRAKSSWFYLLSREAQYFENEKGCRLLP